jgi:ceramide glucosyltransferase
MARLLIMMWQAAAALLALISLGLTVWHWLGALRFPLHSRIQSPESLPPVSILKPVKGSDQHTEECLRSWITQDYPAPVQILFAADSEEDAVCPIIRKLIAGLGPDRARLIICREELVLHPKVSKLMHLEPCIEHEAVVISDADVKVPPDFLRQAIALLENHDVGLVNSFYRLANPDSLPLRMAALHINADFWGQVLQSNSLTPQDFSLGAVMVTRKSEINGIGGFEALGSYLADDYQLGHKIAALGKKIALTRIVVECWSGPMNWSSLWKYQLRQARTIRSCQPLPYFFSILNNATLWPLLWLIISPAPTTVLFLGGALLFRMASAAQNERRLTGSWGHLPYVWLIPLKDLFHVILWAGAFLGNKVHWRGNVLRIGSGGKLKPGQDHGS